MQVNGQRKENEYIEKDVNISGKNRSKEVRSTQEFYENTFGTRI